MKYLLDKLKNHELTKTIFETGVIIPKCNIFKKIIKENIENENSTNFSEIFLYLISYTLNKQLLSNGLKIYYVKIDPTKYTIVMERGISDLETYLRNFDITTNIANNEIKSIIFQVLMSVISIVHCMNFVHNDLHTRNVIYFKTSEPFIYYTFNKRIYKIPTYGKIYKIIDFEESTFIYDNRCFVPPSFLKLEYYKNINLLDVLQNKENCITLNMIYLYRHMSFIIDISKTSIYCNLFEKNNCIFQYNFQNNDRDLEYYYNNINNYKINYHIFNEFLTDETNHLTNKVDEIKLLI